MTPSKYQTIMTWACTTVIWLCTSFVSWGVILGDMTHDFPDQATWFGALVFSLIPPPLNLVAAVFCSMLSGSPHWLLWPTVWG